MTKVELKTFYDLAKVRVSNAGFSDEIRWIEQRHNSSFLEPDLLREVAWVILCAGFKESIVRSVFPFISLCFCDWESAQAIVARSSLCVGSAEAVFRNGAKLAAIVRSAEYVVETGFEKLKEGINQEPLRYLRLFPYIGDVTVHHLAKNLGFQTAKHDRHLARLARLLEFADAQHLCEALSRLSGDPIAVVDTVLWRYSVLAAQPRRVPAGVSS